MTLPGVKFHEHCCIWGHYKSSEY